VTLPPDWDADHAIALSPLLPWNGTVWRGHSPRYGAIDHGGSLKVTGRWHRASDLYLPEHIWPALYTGLDLHVCFGEVLRNATDDRVRQFRYTELRVQLSAVLDYRNPLLFGLVEESLLDDLDFDVPHSIAAAARRRRAEALLVRSASLLGDNLVIFPDLVRGDSQIEEVRFVDPRLVKRR
jgi:hypothetical protein